MEPIRKWELRRANEGPFAKTRWKIQVKDCRRRVADSRGIESLDSDGLISKEKMARLCEIEPAARRIQNEGSHNLRLAFFIMHLFYCHVKLF